MNSRYPAYKPSGVEWIGDVPEHWSTKRLRFLLQPEGVKIGPFGSALKYEHIRSSGVKIYGQEHVIKNDFTLGVKYIDNDKFEELCAYEILPGDVVVTMMGTTGRCKVVPQDILKGIMDSHLTRLRVDSDIYLPELLALVINDAHVVYGQIKWHSKGSIMEGLNSTIIKSLVLPVPPVAEQRAIYDYIQKTSALIDDTIRKKQRLTELLHEERTALINQAVTRGLDPNVPMKSLGVEWLGEIPAHWEVKKVKQLFENLDYKRVPVSSEERGKMTSRAYDYYGASGVIDKVENYLFDGEYILVGEDGANLLTRNTALAFKATGKFWVNNHAHILKPVVGNLDFFVDLLECIDYSIWVSGSAQPKLTAESLGNVHLPVPPVPEQNKIAGYLEKVKSEVERVIQKVLREVELLQEYRTALINEVVTGKRCVVPQAEALATV